MSRVALTETVLEATEFPSFARGTEVFIYERGTEEEATLHSAEEGGATFSQPLITDKGGRPRGPAGALVWIDENSYDLSISGQTVPWEAAKGGGALAKSDVMPGLSNTKLGKDALLSDTTGEKNTAIGTEALKSLTIPSEAVAVGYRALFSFVTGSGEGEEEGFNVAVGSRALANCTTGGGNTAIGYTAGSALTTGEENVAIGCEALGSQTTVSGNTAVGFRALYKNTSGNYNLAIGYQAAEKNTEGSYNIVIGREALHENLTGEQNIAIGNVALEKCTGENNLAIGGGALRELTTGKNNVSIGKDSLGQLTTGTNNVAIGSAAGYTANAGSSGNVFLGKEAGPAESGAVNNKLYIHNGPSNTPLILGDFAAEELQVNATKLALFSGVTPVAQAAAITSPEATSASLKTAVDKLREAVKNVGITE